MRKKKIDFPLTPLPKIILLCIQMPARTVGIEDSRFPEPGDDPHGEPGDPNIRTKRTKPLIIDGVSYQIEEKDNEAPRLIGNGRIIARQLLQSEVYEGVDKNWFLEPITEDQADRFFCNNDRRGLIRAEEATSW